MTSRGARTGVCEVERRGGVGCRFGGAWAGRKGAESEGKGVGFLFLVGVGEGGEGGVGEDGM